MKKIPFWKMHGAGNDFILVDDRNKEFPVDDTEWIASISKRRFGVGCEGVILIQPSKEADFRMQFFNPDGGEVEMCGNGARCVTRLAYEIDAAPKKMTIETVAGILNAEVMGEEAKVELTTPTDWRTECDIDVDGETINYNFVNTGVPHVVVEVPDLNTCNVEKLGSGIRYHEAFQPAGTNANFIAVENEHAIRVRTYERGVEGETLACGTGIVASCLVSAQLGHTKAPVKATAQSGDVITVDFELTSDGAEKVTLLGPATHVFQGTLEYDK